MTQLYQCGECGVGYLTRATALRCHPYIAGVINTDESEFKVCTGGCNRKVQQDILALDGTCADCWAKAELDKKRIYPTGRCPVCKISRTGLVRHACPEWAKREIVDA